MTNPADCNVYHAETYEEYHGLSDACPLCGGETVFIPAPSRAEDAVGCANCEYWEEMIVANNGATVAVGHEPEEVEG